MQKHPSKNTPSYKGTSLGKIASTARSYKGTSLGKIASTQKYAEIPKQKPQAKTLAPTGEKYSQI